MKSSILIILAVLAGLLLGGCTSAPVAPTSTQQTIANAVQDTLSIGLVPVLTKNPDYINAARAVAAALGSFGGSTFTEADVDAVLAKTSLAPEDARTVAGIVNAAWATYQRRYAQRVGASIRPDVKLFLSAVADGITAAIAATPQPAST